ncbi:hypothetical protein SAMN05518865_117113 [Duganella sp. CF458]|uniref:hypothetical protein n=1 Tax=Duganella sp. CF458 TaxID=1884368 RepID=UPI0008EC45F6|nr:hypothetical protein [Duganella sp. CF458]SFG74743.1 hypothetical protein SAMN05518865_117113 [Duganella sp. CF458]
MNKFRSMFYGGLALAMFAVTAPASAGEAYSPFGLRCVANATQADSAKIAENLGSRFSKVWGKDWLTTPTPPKAIDPKVMEEVAAISACAAIVDCPNYFNREIGGELTVFTDIGPKVPLRKQFDAAVAALPASAGKAALQSCMKLEAKK